MLSRIYDIIIKYMIFIKEVPMADDPIKTNDEAEHTFKTIEAKPVTLSENFDYFGQKLHRRILSKSWF